MNMLKDVKKYRRMNVLPTSILGGAEAKEMGDRLRSALWAWNYAKERQDQTGSLMALVELVFMSLAIAVREGAPWGFAWGVYFQGLRKEVDPVKARLLVAEAWAKYEDAPEPMTGIPRRVYTLCGSSRFKDAHLAAMARLTLDGHVVIPMGVYGHADSVLLTGTEKAALDDLHLRKVDMSDGIFVVDVDGYVGDSTRREILYAESQGKEVRYLSRETH